MFNDPDKIWEVVTLMRQVGIPRAWNRERINALFNGNPPYTEQEAVQNHVDTNINWLEGTRILQQARQQYYNSFMRPSKFFSIQVNTGPNFLRQPTSTILTKEINATMKRSNRFYNCQKQVYSLVPLHGIGPCVWQNSTTWCPKAIGIEDLFIPSETLQTFENLDHFAIYTIYTAAELWQMTHTECVDPGWNMPLVDSILLQLPKQTSGVSNLALMDNYFFPEKVEEDYKQNFGYMGSDAVPVVRAYDFYFKARDKDQNEYWQRRIMLDRQSNTVLQEAGINQDAFLFNPGDRKYADNVHQLLHCQYGDGCVVAPARYHSTRSLGFMLYGPCHIQNRLRCKVTDSVFESLLWYFRDVTDGDREKLEKIDLKHLGIIPNGLSWVLPQERHTINQELVGSAIEMNRQLMAEHSAAFTKTADGITQKEMTATEVMAQVNMASALLSSMLVFAYQQEKYKYREIVRRFCTSDDPECRDTRLRCAKQGVDLNIFKDYELYDVEPEQVMGAGNSTLQMAKADKLMQIRGMLPPQGQAIVLHKYVEAVVDDPAMANQIAPIIPASGETPSRERATLAWGTLMAGQPVLIGEGVNRMEYIDTLMQMLDSTVQTINTLLGGFTDQYHIIGLQNVCNYVRQQLQIMGNDKQNMEFIRAVSDSLGKAENYIKAYAQRWQEKQKADAGPQQDPAAIAAAQSQIEIDQAKAKNDIAIKQAKGLQSIQHKQAAFEQNQQLQAARTASDIHHQSVRTKADIALQGVRTGADIHQQQEEGANE